MQHPTQARLGPNRLSGLGADPQSHGQPDLVLLELANDLPSTTKAFKEFEDLLDSLLNLPIRIELDVPLGIIDQAGRQHGPKLSSSGLVQLPPIQSRPQEVQLSLTHRATQSQQQTVIELVRIIQAVLVEDQGIRHRTQLQQPLPIRGIASQPRNLQTEHQTHLAQPHVGHQTLEIRTVCRLGARLAQVSIQSHDLVFVPTQVQRLLPEIVLTFETLRILLRLIQRRLANVQISLAFQVADGNPIRGNHATPPRQWDTTEAKTQTTSGRRGTEAMDTTWKKNESAPPHEETIRQPSACRLTQSSQPGTP